MKYEIFSNDEFGEIRTADINGEPWFVGKDVAAILGYSDTNKAIAMHVDDEDKLNDKTASSLGQRGGWFINESGVYALIFGSKLPTAKKFKHWVTSEVLPAIRKTGTYDINCYSQELRVLMEHERRMAQQQAQLTAVSDKVEAIQETFLLQPDDWKKGVCDAVAALSTKIAGDYSMMHELYSQMYELLEKRAGADLNARLRNRRKRMEESGICKSEIKKVTKLDIVNSDKRLREIFTSILREMSAQNI